MLIEVETVYKAIISDRPEFFYVDGYVYDTRVSTKKKRARDGKQSGGLFSEPAKIKFCGCRVRDVKRSGGPFQEPA